MKTERPEPAVLGAHKNVLILHVVIDQCLQPKGRTSCTQLLETALAPSLGNVTDVLVEVVLGRSPCSPVIPLALEPAPIS
eukprot:2268483-Prorocentrum_lima.AAC.1